MTVVAILNPKGGGGKTTLATDLARARHESGRSVFVVDSDSRESARDWQATNESNPLPSVALDRANDLNTIRSMADAYNRIVIVRIREAGKQAGRRHQGRRSRPDTGPAVTLRHVGHGRPCRARESPAGGDRRRAAGGVRRPAQDRRRETRRGRSPGPGEIWLARTRGGELPGAGLSPDTPDGGYPIDPRRSPVGGAPGASTAAGRGSAFRNRHAGIEPDP